MPSFRLYCQHHLWEQLHAEAVLSRLERAGKVNSHITSSLLLSAVHPVKRTQGNNIPGTVLRTKSQPKNLKACLNRTERCLINFFKKSQEKDFYRGASLVEIYCYVREKRREDSYLKNKRKKKENVSFKWNFKLHYFFWTNYISTEHRHFPPLIHVVKHPTYHVCEQMQPKSADSRESLKLCGCS